MLNISLIERQFSRRSWDELRHLVWGNKDACKGLNKISVKILKNWRCTNKENDPNLLHKMLLIHYIKRSWFIIQNDPNLLYKTILIYYTAFQKTGCCRWIMHNWERLRMQMSFWRLLRNIDEEFIAFSPGFIFILLTDIEARPEKDYWQLEIETEAIFVKIC